MQPIQWNRIEEYINLTSYQLSVSRTLFANNVMEAELIIFITRTRIQLVTKEQGIYLHNYNQVTSIFH